MKRSVMWAVLFVPFVFALTLFGQQTAEEYFNKGVELYEAKNYNEAAAAFEKAIEVKPDYAESYYNLSVTYWQQKQYQKVLEKLQKVIELAPGSDVAKKAEDDIKKLKAAGISYVAPGEEEGEEEEGEETPRTVKPSEKPEATLPELIEDLQFGPTSKRIAAAKWLGSFPEKEAVDALGKVTEKSEELPEIKIAAVESLGETALPSAIPFLQKALEAPDFPAEGKQAVIKALDAINTTESLKIIVSAWAGNWPGGLSDQNVVELIRKKGVEDFADIIRPAYFQTTGEKKMYMALALGILKDATGVPLMVNRLQEDYPGDATPKTSFNQPYSSGTLPGMPGTAPSLPTIPGMTPGVPRALPPGMAGGPRVAIPGAAPGGIAPPLAPGGTVPSMPGMPRIGTGPAATPILKEQIAIPVGWSRKDEIGLRVEIVEVLGTCAGEKQKPFLIYLSKNDSEKKVREAALEAVKNMESRIASSTENYQKGIALAKEGKTAEAIPLLKTALKENPDASYAEEIKKLVAKFNYDQALVLLKENKKEEAIALLQSALELYPGAPFRNDAEAKLASLQVPVRGTTGVFYQPGQMIPGAPRALPPGMAGGPRVPIPGAAPGGGTAPPLAPGVSAPSLPPGLNIPTIPTPR